MAKTKAQLDREIADFIAKGQALRRELRAVKNPATRTELLARIKEHELQVTSRRPRPPIYPAGTGVWRKLDD